MTLAIGFAVTVILTWFLMPYLIRFLLERGIGDIIDDRRMHISFTPTAGGIGVMVPIFVSAFIGLMFFQFDQLLLPVLAVFFITITGAIDDIYDLKASRKLAMMILPAVVLTVLGFRVDSLYGLAGIYEIPGYLSYPLTILIYVFLTNAFNLIDGVDGLLNVVASFMFIVLGSWFFLVGEYAYSFLAFSFLGGSLGFLIYNWSPAKIFMGDTGSLSIGFVMAVFGITFLKVNDGLPVAFEFHIDTPVSFIITLLIFPIFDTFRVFLLRIWNKTSPFKADKRHIHHCLSYFGFNHRMIALTALVFNVMLFIGVSAIDQLSDSMLILVVTGILFLCSFTIYIFRTHRVTIAKRRTVTDRELEIH
ncbi:undecaprenyl/decaprenyl-phosphate alpha-N-acetylglucosaminyl 1-phosphate transferase [Belliella sp. DSM 111904]|uniref:Undecaprenyl/decaprenyl-phosphate alpha-N-acetylglucosaminyl 1-phosphate transferase n=1 Tax=Belliella filtrata TaxID=2923435 RepID=A0ABS9V5I7_9BACT|nr:MraY family glycosyltransferase [Belliella filtrata]MCH7411686.1 undecaprenyl/decaprenyl-phosphate alpha-N-acetylglucosaminyl 1-phosphate transferase [Belliella filtrata]